MSANDDDTEHRASAVLDQLRTPLPRNNAVFVIRAPSGPVAIYAQQVRALNLIWALEHSKQIDGTTTVVIVGAGAAGLTAAAAAGLAGAKRVIVLEKAASPMSLQLGCHHRFLHPRLFTWPDQRSLMAAAHLPILSWSVGTADEVARKILEAFEQIRAQLGSKKIKVETGVSDIRLSPDGRRIEYWTSRRARTENPQVLIFAVGFGIERTVEGLPTRSYWRLDPLDQTPLTPAGRSHKVLVAGEGDGGLIDVLRARLDRFDYGPYFDRCLHLLWEESFRRVVKDIEGEARESWKEGLVRYGPSNRLFAKEAACQILNQRYSERLLDKGKFVAPLHDVWAYMASRLRRGVEVTLAGRLEVPTNIESQVLNRLLVWVLWRRGAIAYRRARITKVLPVQEANGLWKGFEAVLASVSLAHKGGVDEYVDGPTDRPAYDDVIVRYGAVSPLEADFKLVHAAWTASDKHVGSEQPALFEEAYCLFSEKRKRLERRTHKASPLVRASLSPGGPVTQTNAAGKRWPCYRIQLVIRRAPAVARWAEYSLHPDYKGLRRRADRGDEGDFATWVYTYDDYWVEASLSSGETVQGGWLTDLLKGNDGAVEEAKRRLREAATKLWWPHNYRERKGRSPEEEGKAFEAELERAAHRPDDTTRGRRGRTGGRGRRRWRGSR